MKKTPTDIEQEIRDLSRSAYLDYQLDGIGQIRLPGAQAANTDVTIAHTLNRVPNRVECLDNGTSFTPQIKRSTVTAWTAAIPPNNGSVTVQFSVALVAGAVIRIG